MRKIAANDDLMTTREAGERLGVAVRTVQLWVEAGLLPAWRTAGGHRRIARSAVEALVAERSEMLVPASTASVATPVMRLLVVEDDAIMMRLVCQVIKAWNLPIEVSTSSNGFEGLVRIGEMRPDVVITDLRMPGIDGFQMLQMLKRPGSGYESLRVIVISALNAQDLAEKGGLPADVAFLPKPVHFGELETLVRQYLPKLKTATLSKASAKSSTRAAA